MVIGSSDTVFQEYDQWQINWCWIIIQVKDGRELEEDTIEVSTSKNANVVVDAYNAIGIKEEIWSR